MKLKNNLGVGDLAVVNFQNKDLLKYSVVEILDIPDKESKNFSFVKVCFKEDGRISWICETNLLTKEQANYKIEYLISYLNKQKEKVEGINND